MRVRLSKLAKTADALQRRISEISAAVTLCDEADVNSRAVQAHNVLMDTLKKSKNNLLTYYKEILDIDAKSHNQLYKKLLKEKRNEYQD